MKAIAERRYAGFCHRDTDQIGDWKSCSELAHQVNVALYSTGSILRVL